MTLSILTEFFGRPNCPTKFLDKFFGGRDFRLKKDFLKTELNCFIKIGQHRTTVPKSGDSLPGPTLLECVMLKGFVFGGSRPEGPRLSENKTFEHHAVECRDQPNRLKLSKNKISKKNNF